MFQPQNAFQIKNFFFDKTDKELDAITPFFEFLAEVYIRYIIRRIIVIDLDSRCKRSS